MFHRITLALLRRPVATLRRARARPAALDADRAAAPFEPVAALFHWTALGLYLATCVASGWVVLRALS